jgi:hypothetical protein
MTPVNMVLTVSGSLHQSGLAISAGVTPWSVTPLGTARPTS